MLRTLFFTFLLFIGIINTVKAVTIDTIFISSKGSDLGLGNFEKPFLTLSRAIKKAEKSKSLRSVIFFRAGKYTILNTIVIENLIPSKHIVISNYKDEKVLLSGGLAINSSDVQKIKDSAIINRLPNSIINKIYKIDLKKLGITNYGHLIQHGHRNISPSPMELFFNDVPLTLARWPNVGYIPIGKVLFAGVKSKKNKVGAKFHYNTDRPNNWKNKDDIWISGFLSNGYANDNIRIENLNPVSKEITLQSSSNYGVKSAVEFYKGSKKVVSHRRFFFYNILEELDTPGEWYLDRKNGVVYFYPPDDIVNPSIFVSMNDGPIISLLNSRNVTIKGIEFGYGRDMGVFAQNTTNITIKDCVFKNFGTLAISLGKHHSDIGLKKSYEDLISFDTNTKFSIKSCLIYNTGTGGVFLTGGNRKMLISSGNSVENCEIRNFSRRNMVSCPAVFIGGVGNIVRNCSIHDSEGQAIMYWGNNHDISYNRIFDVVNEINDQGAVYTGRDPSSTGTRIHHNLFSDISSNSGYLVSAVYIDDGSGGIKVDNNIFYKCKSKYGAIHINGGSHNNFNNNYFIHCEKVVSMTAWNIQKWKRIMNSPDMIKKLTSIVNVKSPTYQTQYPFLKNLLNEKYNAGKNRFSNSLINNVAELGFNNRMIIHENTVKSTEDLAFKKLSNNDFLKTKLNDTFKFSEIKYIDISTIGPK